MLPPTVPSSGAARNVQGPGWRRDRRRASPSGSHQKHHPSCHPSHRRCSYSSRSPSRIPDRGNIQVTAPSSSAGSAARSVTGPAGARTCSWSFPIQVAIWVASDQLPGRNPSRHTARYPSHLFELYPSVRAKLPSESTSESSSESPSEPQSESTVFRDQVHNLSAPRPSRHPSFPPSVTTCLSSTRCLPAQHYQAAVPRHGWAEAGRTGLTRWRRGLQWALLHGR